MANTYVNKVQLADGTSLIDISDTTATADKILTGFTAYGADGSKLTGTATGGGGSVTQDQDGYIVLPPTGGGGGGSTLITKSITLNGTYDAEDDNADGYSEVTVNVQGGASVTETQGTYGTEVVVTSGSAPSATSHTIYFEFEDETDETIIGYWNGTFISDAVTATTPTTYDSKTVTLAQLDGVTWYSYDPHAIPIGVQLIDYSKVTSGYIIDGSSGQPVAYEWGVMSDYTLIDPSMTFDYIGDQWFYIGFYDSSKNPISTIYMYDDATTKVGDYAHGTLTPAKIPSNATYVIVCSVLNAGSNELSLIRTA